uniref:DUF4834 family protein n=1 Tax=Prevotella sp. GTC17260 TaxID=3236796 RepID=A0AB33J967_9BACT
MVFLKLIFFIFVAGLLALVFIAYSFFRRLRDSARKMQDQVNGRYAGRASASSSTRRTYSDKEGETVVDQRTSAEANQKIFSKDEGEYVDFKEE